MAGVGNFACSFKRGLAHLVTSVSITMDARTPKGTATGHFAMLIPRFAGWAYLQETTQAVCVRRRGILRSQPALRRLAAAVIWLSTSLTTAAASFSGAAIQSVACVQATFQAGGHGHLEQPANATTWLQPEIQSFLRITSASCVLLPACLFGRDWARTWLLATSLSSLRVLGGVCAHGAAAHSNEGAFRSQAAEYPPQLAESFAAQVIPLFRACSGQDLSFEAAEERVPLKSFDAAPFARHDGGGYLSTPDWSSPPAASQDVFRPLRAERMQRIVSQRLYGLAQDSFQRGSPDAPLPEETVQDFRNSLSELLASANLPCDCTIPPGQPFYLHVMQSLSLLLQDPDNSLFFHLVQGVPTGYKNDIPPSNCFPVKQEHLPEQPPLSVHHVNWKSAEDNLPMTREQACC